MPDDVAPRGWTSHIRSPLTAYHEPTSMQTVPSEDAFVVQTRVHTARNLLPTVGRPSLHSSYCSASFAERPIEKPVTRRLMYDPVRDSVASSSPAASSDYKEPVSRSLKPQHRAPTTIHQEGSSSHNGAGRTTPDARYTSDNEDDDSLIRARFVRENSRCASDGPLAADPPQLHNNRPLSDTYRVDSSSAVHAWRADPEVGAGAQEPGRYPTSRASSEASGPSSHKRSCAEIEDDVDHRYRKTMLRRVNGYSSVDAKGKGKAVVAQSPAFRLDHLLEPSGQDSAPNTGDGIRSRSPSESHAANAESSYVFTGKLPPPPFIGHSTAASSAHTSIGDLGITVSKDVNLGRFAVPDAFERAILTTPGPLTDIIESSLSLCSSETPPNAKRARKHSSTSQRRKTRGVFPQDNVPLAISTSTTKQSRYRPSGDRQPVACGYKDPITQIQCDEPFNRSVELRRHVRAVHVPAEALAVTMGQLSRSQATLLPADWKPGDGDVLRPKCLCGKEFSRLDALRRHWTGVQAVVKEGKCVFCPSSMSKKKDHSAFEQQGAESTYGAPVHS